MNRQQRRVLLAVADGALRSADRLEDVRGRLRPPVVLREVRGELRELESVGLVASRRVARHVVYWRTSQGAQTLREGTPLVVVGLVAVPLLAVGVMGVWLGRGPAE